MCCIPVRFNLPCVNSKRPRNQKLSVKLQQCSGKSTCTSFKGACPLNAKPISQPRSYRSYHHLSNSLQSLFSSERHHLVHNTLRRHLTNLENLRINGTFRTLCVVAEATCFGVHIPSVFFFFCCIFASVKKWMVLVPETYGVGGTWTMMVRTASFRYPSIYVAIQPSSQPSIQPARPDQNHKHNISHSMSRQNATVVRCSFKFSFVASVEHDPRWNLDVSKNRVPLTDEKWWWEILLVQFATCDFN